MSKLFAGFVLAGAFAFVLGACAAGACGESASCCSEKSAECGTCPSTGAKGDSCSASGATEATCPATGAKGEACHAAASTCSDDKNCATDTCCEEKSSAKCETKCEGEKAAAGCASKCEAEKSCCEMDEASASKGSCPETGACPVAQKGASLEATLGASGAELVWGAKRFDGGVVLDAFAADNELFAVVKGQEGFEVHCIELTTGVPRWLTVVGKTPFRTRPTVSAQHVVCLLDNGGGMVVLKRRNGARDGRVSTPLKLVPVGGAGSTESTVFVTSLADNAVHAVSPADGLTGWRWRTTGTMFNGPVMTPSGRRMLVVVGTGDGEITALPSAGWDEGQPSSPAWTRKLLGDLNGELCTYSTSTKGAVTSSILASCQDHGLYCLDGASGTSRWVFRTDSPFTGKPQAAGGKAFAINGSGLHVLDLATGAEQWLGKDGKPGCYAMTKRMLAASAKAVYLTCGEGIGRFDATTGAMLGGCSTEGVDFLVETGDAGLLVGLTRCGQIAVMR